MSIFIAHPSVRIRGTENSYNPVECFDSKCCEKTSHLHCPFCVKTEVYHDPVILRAHYRVKHVDKGIDFAGLRILRCCEQCDIVGAIKGEKKFKGAHWHCYRCKNGFNRRDEAVKHYKTHFRNPLTTFQIHIAQEVNVPVHNYESMEITESQNSITTTSGRESYINGTSVIGGAYCLNGDSTSPVTNDNEDETEDAQMAVEAIDPLRLNAEHGTIMIIQDDQVEDNSNTLTVNTPTMGQAMVMAGSEVQFFDDKITLQNKILELEQQNQQLRHENKRLESHYEKEVQLLKAKIESQEKAIANLKKSEHRLKHQLLGPISDQTEELLSSLQKKHGELLQQQMIQIRRMALAQQGHTRVLPSPKVVTLVLKSNNTVTPAKVLLTRMDDHNQPVTTVSFHSTPDHQDDDAVVTENSPNEESILGDYESNSNEENLATIDIS